MPDKTRRNVLKSVATGVAGTSAIVAPVAARRTRRSRNDEKKSHEEFEQIFQRGRPDQAREFLDEEGVNYSASTGYPSFSEGEVSAQSRYVNPDKNGNTQVNITLVSGSGDKVKVYVDFDLHEDDGLATINDDNTCPPDGCAVFWNSTYWKAVSKSRSNFRSSWVDADGSSLSSDGGSISYGEPQNNGGFLAEVDDAEPQDGDGINATFSGGFRWDLEKKSSFADWYPISVVYDHTWVYASCVIGSFGVGLAAGSITHDNSPNDWSMGAQTTV